MNSAQLATWMLEREARAMLARLDRVKPFAVQETMLPAAALSPAAQTAIERYLISGRRALRRQIRRYISWLQGPGLGAARAEQQRRFTFLRLRFNLALSQIRPVLRCGHATEPQRDGALAIWPGRGGTRCTRSARRLLPGPAGDCVFCAPGPGRRDPAGPHPAARGR